jgi:hypothetical protein
MELGAIPSSPSSIAGRLPFRQLIGDPFDLRRRAVIPAITTLTLRLRRYPAEPSFLLHWRDPSKVATAAGVYNVVPAGEFQPPSVALWDRHSDFDLWRNVVREYSEELLGAPEHNGTRTHPIEYDRWVIHFTATPPRAHPRCLTRSNLLLPSACRRVGRPRPPPGEETSGRPSTRRPAQIRALN